MPDTLTLTSAADGQALSALRWSAEGPIRGQVLVAHGMGEHAGRYAPFAQALAAQGFLVLAPDHRGHGHSIGPGGPGDFGSGGWEALVADMAQWLESFETTVPTVLFGHSMGSLAAQQYACERDEHLAGLILSGSTCFDLLPVPEEGPAGLAAFNAAFEPARTDFDWLSADADQVDRYIADPLCGFDAAPDAMAGMFAAAARIATPAALGGLRADLPVLLLAGDADPLNAGGTLIEALADRWRDAGVERVDVRRHAQGRHEMLNETNRGEVITEVVNWIKFCAA
ncbi:MAG TPA: alpha/beta hydrolase [Pseudomonadales bacterium]|nr:alpha/beta hydrolase [Pseudomonadales bacterium]